MPASENAYSQIVERLFFRHYSPGRDRLGFERSEAPLVAEEIGIKVPKNLGDILYTFRFRRPLPQSILSTAPEGSEWSIELAGDGKYEFILVRRNRIEPSEGLSRIDIPDATPEVIRAHATSDEQALLAVLRYNRLVDMFLGITAFSLQNHLRTKVRGIGQIEIDELYVGIDRDGRQYIVPVQAKGGSDYLGISQFKQDNAFCREKYPRLEPRLVAAQFLTSHVVAMFELLVEGDDVLTLFERHYRLVRAKAGE